MKEKMIKYLLQETRYTRQELESLPAVKLEKWYKEERTCNR